MANRHLARSVVLQVLFERDASEGTMTLDDCYSRLESYSQEFGARTSDLPFMQNLLKTVTAKQKEIDSVITKASPAPGRTPSGSYRWIAIEKSGQT